MNILILTGRFGMGHYSASEAVKQEIQKEYANANIDIVDIVEYLIPATSKFVYGSFELLVSKFGNLYNFFNKAMGQRCIVPLRGQFLNKVDKLFIEYQPDIVISTLPLSSQYISVYKQSKGINIPLITYITDISWHDEWIAKNTDYYFVGADNVKKYLVEKGISAEKIKVSGIPVKQNFKIYDKLSIHNERKELLIMGGGLGLIDIDESLFKKLNEEENIRTTIITGNNKKMYNHIKEMYGNIDVVGYSSNVYDYMQKADLIVSKAGGITLYEAIYSEVPMYVINPFLIQEVRNCEYIEQERIGKVIWSKEKNVTEDIISLLNDDKSIVQMKNNMSEIKNFLDKDSINLTIDRLKKGA